ncbi:glycosyltransferase family 8 protein [Parasphingorhabdus sp.]|jgi:lipopolysaccharide biosynthesis glycosyltransferase|uniref:glycosyltransferase family 8 protein n=1 Tax=Parasphingorhabdus sp. TaxID=2709688 RepID=UPI0039E508FC
MTDDLHAQKIGLATVTSEEFLPGTLVMLSSFLTHNKWFRGDITIIHQNLGDASVRLLTDCFPNVIMHPISDALGLRLDELAEAVPWIGIRKLQFGSLEVLSLVDQDRIIFCDSDLLFLDSVEQLIALPDPLICCGDGAFYRGNSRSRTDFSELPPTAAKRLQLQEPFNSGFMILGKSLLSEVNYQAVLSMITADRWQSDATGHTDQMLFNLLFAGQQKLVSPVYNYTLSHRNVIQQSRGIALPDAKVLHFTGPAKPWLPMEVLHRADDDPAIIAAFQMWHDGFVEFLTRRKLATIHRS